MEPNPNKAGVDQAWVKELLKDQEQPPKKWSKNEVKQIETVKPKSRIQEFLQDIFEALIEVATAQRVIVRDNGEVDELPSEDHFDKWYENNDIAKYTQKYKLATQINLLLNDLSLTGSAGEDEASMEAALGKLANAVIEDPYAIYVLEKSINGRYPNLVAFMNLRTSEEDINNYEEIIYNKKMSAIDDKVSSNIEIYEAELAKIKRAARTDFEILAHNMNGIVIAGSVIWELMFYSIMSPYAPKIKVNSLYIRSNLHGLLTGDISTAKSKMLEILKMVAPHSLTVDDTTKATFEGVAKIGDGIQDGVLDMANDGVMIVEELTKKLTDMPLWRRAMDCKPIRIFKGGDSKELDINTTVLAACNPLLDFFQDEVFRSQLPFKEGILSRFDILIPLTNTSMKNELIIDGINLFGDSPNKIDLEGTKEALATIAKGMKTIKEVVLTQRQKTMLKNTFLFHNSRDKGKPLIKYRPFVIFRDLETLARLVNIVVATSFSNRSFEDGRIHAKDEDILKAIYLWENMLHMRVELYGPRQSRNILSVSDEIIIFINNAQRANGDELIPYSDVANYIVSDKKLISKPTFDRQMKRLREGRRIIQQGEKHNHRVGLIIS